MSNFKLISNIKRITNSQYVNISTENCEPRKLLAEKIKQLKTTYPYDIIIIGAAFAGRRCLNNQNLDDIAKLINGRRIRIYYAIAKANKIHIIFEWIKIKHLNEQEIQFIMQNWNDDFFHIQGKHLIQKFGGACLENLIYRICKDIL